MDASSLGINPQMLTMIATKLGINPAELMQQIQNNPQIIQQVMELMNQPQGGAPEAEGGWMDKAASAQAAPGARPPVTPPNGIQDDDADQADDVLG